MKHQPFSLPASIGMTPLVELRAVNPNPRVRILAKLEGNNTGGSVKDRPALYMIDQGRGVRRTDPRQDDPGADLRQHRHRPGHARRGQGLPGEAGHAGLRQHGAAERPGGLRRRGGPVAGGEATDGAIRMAHRILADEPERYYMPNQYENPNNVLAHYETTGPEILRQTDGEIDAFVAGMGTSGTLMGVSRFMRERQAGVAIIGVEPRLGHKVQGLKNMKEAIVPGIYRPEALDRKLTIEDEEAFETTRMLAVHEGLFVGMSSGAAVAGAIEIAKEMSSGTIVTLLPDRGDRYLSTALFRSVCACCPP